MGTKSNRIVVLLKTWIPHNYGNYVEHEIAERFFTKSPGTTNKHLKRKYCTLGWLSTMTCPCSAYKIAGLSIHYSTSIVLTHTI